MNGKIAKKTHIRYSWADRIFLWSTATGRNRNYDIILLYNCRKIKTAVFFDIHYIDKNPFVLTNGSDMGIDFTVIRRHNHHIGSFDITILKWSLNQ